jgi:ribosomal protein S18 acetylase RimI-like enzyme
VGPARRAGRAPWPLSREDARVSGDGEQIIRQAVPGDEEAIARVKVAGWESTYSAWASDAVLRPHLDERAQAASIRDVLADGENVTFVALSGNSLIGFALCLVAGRPEPFLDSFHVLAEWRAHGVGALLLRALAAELDARGRRTLALHVVEQNTRARELYERLGARHVGDGPARWAPGEIVEAHFRWPDIEPLLEPAA